jgi:hypothetical protein
MRTRTVLVSLAVLVTTIAAVLDLGVATRSAATRRPTTRTTIGSWPSAVTGAAPAEVAAAVAQAEAEARTAWYAGVEAARAAELEAAARARTTAPVEVPATVGECTGFAIPDWIIWRESRGNASAYNPSGAYGCAQTLLSHYADGRTCGGLDPYSIDGQRECVWRLSAGGTNLQPWAF